MHVTLLAGTPEPLGATWDGHGVNFALFSEPATRVDLCLFDGQDAAVESRRIALPEQTDHVWHGYLTDLHPGQLYGYRVDGPYDPAAGHRCNPAKLLFDPYARQVGRTLTWHDALLDERRPERTGGNADPRDTARWAPLAMVSDPTFRWEDDRPPRTPWSDTVLYELHVKGFTWRHPAVPPALRGTYLGVSSDPAIDHFTSLGVTALELLPVHQHVSERALVDGGLTNYWGYNTLGFLAPDVRYATSPGTAVVEFKTMVRRLHAAGLEVILDVVYNHTAEGDRFGPTLSWRGIDNASYYRLHPDDRGAYQDFTGCGNTLDLRHPRVRRLIVDSLRYWVDEMHVDGFRFDLASALTREQPDVNLAGAFCRALQDDPVLAGVKLIAEPWDLGAGGYQLGGFPQPFREWNDRYRDTARRFWRGDAGQVSDLATRLAGSRDLFDTAERPATSSVNFVTAHDGFTLADLVSYGRKRNTANGEQNRDGAHENYSSNGGVDGATDDPVVRERRARRRRSLLATLLVSHGVPMLSAGDEVGRTQQGNNNAYCQDSETSWVDWRPHADTERLRAFVQSLLAFRAAHPSLRPTRFPGGPAADSVPDIVWFDCEGHDITPAGWHAPRASGLAMCVPGVSDDDAVLVLLNAADRPMTFRLPEIHDVLWCLRFDTARDHVDPPQVSKASYEVGEHAVAIFETSARPAANV